MAYTMIVVIIALIGFAFPASAIQTTPIPEATTTTPTTWIDPHAGGKSGNPGARIFVGKKSMDAVHEYVSDMISRAILGMTVADLVLPVGTGALIVKPPRVTEASFGKSEYQMVPPNRIRSRFFDGRLAANGVWQYKPNIGSLMGGTYKATIQGTELNSTNQLGRSYEAKPTIQTVECQANISHFRIEVQGSSQIKVIENCDMEICLKIRNFFERTICQLFEGFVKEVLNRELQRVPNRMSIQGEQYKIDYGLLFGEPTVNDSNKCISAGMEGKYIWRGSSGVPFSAPEMEWVDRGRMYSFQISDYTFNTLLHQAHSSGHRFSASEVASTSMRQFLSLNCDGSAKTTPVATPSPKTTKPTPPTTTTPKPKTTKPSARKYRGPPAASDCEGGRCGGRGGAAEHGMKCLGSLFANFTNFGPFSANDTGDIVYKSNQKAPAVYVDSDKRGFFDGSSGVLEFYGPLSAGGYRPLLARADVRLMRGDFVPKLNKANVTGSIKLNTFQLAQQSTRSMTPDWLATAAYFSMPFLTDSINAFLDRYAQFPLPLQKKYECVSPQFTAMARSIQLDCDIQRTIHERSGCACVSASGTCACESDSYVRGVNL